MGVDDLLNRKDGLFDGASTDPWSGAITPLPTQPAPPAQLPTPAETTPLPKQPAPPAQGPAITPTTWNTDGYATPGYTAGSYGNVLSGWEASKWNDTSHQTPKYVIGRILSNYPDTPGGLSAAMADIARAYPGASLLDNGKSGKINIPGVGVVDVGVSFGSGGGQGWAWQPAEAISQPQASTAASTASTASNPWASQLSQLQNVLASPTTGGSTAAPGQTNPTGKPAADGRTDWQVGAPVPSMPGMVYNQYGGYESAQTFQQTFGTASAPTTSQTGTTATDQTVATLQQLLSQFTSPATSSTSAAVPPDNGFTDPATQTLDALIRQRIAALNTPITDPTQAQATDTIQAQIQRLLTPLQTPAETQTFQDVLSSVIQQLQGPTFDDPSLANLKTIAFDTLNQQEQSELQNVQRSAALRGVPPTSGVVDYELQKVRDKYAQLRAQQQQQLNQYTIDSATQRRSQLLQAAQTGSNVAQQQQQQEESRKAQVTSLAQQLVEMARAARGEQSTNANQAISFAGVPVDITERRVANAANIGSGSSASASNVTQILSNLMNAFNNQSSTNQANSSTYLQDLSKALSQIDWSKVFG